jgi:hypothetical protein
MVFDGTVIAVNVVVPSVGLLKEVTTGSALTRLRLGRIVVGITQQSFPNTTARQTRLLVEPKVASSSIAQKTLGIFHRPLRGRRPVNHRALSGPRTKHIWGSLLQ